VKSSAARRILSMASHVQLFPQVRDAFLAAVKEARPSLGASGDAGNR